MHLWKKIRYNTHTFYFAIYLKNVFELIWCFEMNILNKLFFDAVAICIINVLFSTTLGRFIHLGINLINLLTIGILGISGFGLVFVVAAFSVL